MPGTVLSKSHSITDNLYEGGVLKFVVSSTNNTAFKDTDDSMLATFKIACSKSVKAGTYTGRINTIELSTLNNALEVEQDVAFSITVLEATHDEYTASSVIALSCSRIYGDENPDFKYIAIGGNTYGDPLLTCSATAQSPVGTYPIRVAQGDMLNDKVSFVEGTLTILPAPLFVSGGKYNKYVGQRMPKMEPQYFGFKADDDPSVLESQPTLRTQATPESPEGIYAVEVSGAKAKNYTINYSNGTITVSTMGDIDGDGVFSIDDVIQFVDMYLLNYTLGE